MLAGRISSRRQKRTRDVGDEEAGGVCPASLIERVRGSGRNLVSCCAARDRTGPPRRLRRCGTSRINYLRARGQRKGGAKANAAFTPAAPVQGSISAIGGWPANGVRPRMRGLVLALAGPTSATSWMSTSHGSEVIRLQRRRGANPAPHLVPHAEHSGRFDLCSSHICRT